jgi:HD-GYP domain-containing protein (c-di-GMP phosphodiesterase class II)
MHKDIPYDELIDTFEDQRLLIEIGRDLMHERDTDKLLRKILDISRQMTAADAGSIFLAEEQDGKPVLRFKYTYTASKPLPYEEFVMPRTMGSIAGYVSLTGTSLNINDVYLLPEDLPYSFNDSFDIAHGYRSKSMLTVPMLDHTGAIVGVIQLLNSKEVLGVNTTNPDAILLVSPEDFEHKVVPFKDRYIHLMEAVASQAAISLDNANMIRRIKSQFEQFVVAAVDAVEARDPATSGHSSRVAHYACALALAINEEATQEAKPELFTPVALKELEFSGVLHDFGKVYIEPAIFQKAKKLFPGDLDRLRLRLKYLRRSLELDFAERCLDCNDTDRKCIAEEREQSLETITRIGSLIEDLNEPRILEEDPADIIDRIFSSDIPPVKGVNGEEIPLLTDSEIFNLCVKRGSLNPDERAEIERHVVLSYEFVKQIPWPPEYANIPKYVRAHHEMLDGSGYPDKLQGDDIPVQSQLLAVADIYDALTASDRPYKKAAPPERALAILDDEAKRGRLNSHYVGIMRHLVESRSLGKEHPGLSCCGKGE